MIPRSRGWAAVLVVIACHNEPGDLRVSRAYSGTCAVHAWLDDTYHEGEGFELARGEAQMFPGLEAGLHRVGFAVSGTGCGRRCELYAAGGAEADCFVFVAAGFPGEVAVVDEGACALPRLSCSAAAVAQDFDLAIAEDALTIKRGRTAELHVTIARRGNAGPITVSATGLPMGTGANPITIAAGATSGTMTVIAGAQAVQGTVTVTLTGSPAGAMSMPSDTVSVTFTGASGDLDTSFAGDGVLEAPVGAVDAELRDGVILPDDGFVGVGTAGGDWVIAKVRADGTPDPGFGSDGIVTLVFPGAADVATRIARAPDGALFVIGSAGVDFTVAELDGTTGALVAGFGTGGIATVDVSGEADVATAVAVIAGGARIVVGGVAGTTDPDFALVGLTTAGKLDAGFSGGTVRTALAGDDRLGAIAIDASDRIWAAGTRLTAPQGQPTSLVMRRYAATGALDTGFGTGGLATGSSTFGVTPLADLVLTASGAAQYLHEGGGEQCEQMTAAGGLDGGFASGGTFLLMQSAGYVHGIAAVPEGTIVVGTAYDAGGGTIWRVTPAGAHDLSFGPSGAGFAGGGPFEMQDVLVDSQGRYVVMGWKTPISSTQRVLAAARYWP